jgi:putative two-component system response regulator
MLLLRGYIRPRHRVRMPLLWIRERLRQIDLEACRSVDPGPWLRRAATLTRCADPDPDHGTRVAQLAELLALAIGWSPESAEQLRHAAELHDIGKYALPRSLLTYAGPLSPDQRRLLVLHTHAADWLLDGLAHPVFHLGRTVGRGHHERWDGRGYPSGASGDAIPLAARLVAASDIWDALTHPRPYRPAYSSQEAGALVAGMAGEALDPEITEALLHLVTPRQCTEPAHAT